MLLSFRVANFLSIRDEQEFSFVNGSSAAHPGAEGWDSSVGTLAGIFGANASGKSNVLKAIDFMAEAVSSSYISWASKDSIPVTPFALDTSREREPSLFEAEYQFRGVRYQYGFRVTSSQVVNEWLYAYVTHRRQVWFERDATSGDPWHFGKSFMGRNRIISDLTGPATLFLSAAVANNHEMARQVARFFRAQLYNAWPDDRGMRVNRTKRMASDSQAWNSIVDLMRFADLGIRDARVRREIMDDEEQQIMAVMVKAAMGQTAKEEDVNAVLGIAADQVEFGHSTGSSPELVYLPWKSESLGTQNWFALVGPIVKALSNGSTLAVDEIDSSLHPHLTAEVLRIFADPARNPKQAQLLFTSHDTTLLGGLLGDAELTRDQVWFTEKKADGATVLYPLTDFSPRRTENLERGYLQGRYGAVPYLNRPLLPEVSGEQAGSADESGADAEGLSVSIDTDTDDLR